MQEFQRVSKGFQENPEIFMRFKKNRYGAGRFSKQIPSGSREFNGVSVEFLEVFGSFRRVLGQFGPGSFRNFPRVF